MNTCDALREGTTGKLSLPTASHGVAVLTTGGYKNSGSETLTHGHDHDNISHVRAKSKWYIRPPLDYEASKTWRRRVLSRRRHRTEEWQLETHPLTLGHR